MAVFLFFQIAEISGVRQLVSGIEGPRDINIQL
jgi:hypothetical protein